MKPWFWILLLFFGPLTYILVFQWDMFVGVSDEIFLLLPTNLIPHLVARQCTGNGHHDGVGFRACSANTTPGRDRLQRCYREGIVSQSRPDELGWKD
jgi:hypothetical protein